MTHFELVQSATDLLAEQSDPQAWLAAYDTALTSSTDTELGELLVRLSVAGQHSVQIAA